MTRNQQAVCVSRSKPNTTRRSAFTLIELLVVVAIIALLISILLPSLASAREGARASVCLSNCKQLGNAVLMYTVDNKLCLPGPVHNPIYHSTADVLALELQSGTPPATLYYSVNLPAYLSKYLADSSKSAKLVDKVATCPTADRIPVQSSGAAQAPMYRLPAGHYVANTGGKINDQQRSQKAGIEDERPYYKTKPADYFGWTNVGCPKDYTGARMPLPVEQIRRQSDEWMIADLWYWEGSYLRRGAAGIKGTWPIEPSGVATSSVIYNGKLKVPSYPYHNTTRSFDPTLIPNSDHEVGSARISTGKTNNVYFDGHAAGVRKWKGSVNPSPDWP